MLRYMLIYGALSGAIVIGSAVLGSSLAGTEHVAGLEWLGYLIMLLALTLVFVGIKQYRDRVLGGVIRFGTGVLLGLGMSVVAGIIYVAVWEVYLATTDHAFIEAYTTGLIEARRAEGLSGPELQALIAEMETLQAQYANPLFRLPMTFLEIFPVGLLVTLVSAAILRNSRVLPARAAT